MRRPINGPNYEAAENDPRRTTFTRASDQMPCATCTEPLWKHRPDGLRTVCNGERFRMFLPNTTEPQGVAVADEDGHEVLDERGAVCGGLECFIESGWV